MAELELTARAICSIVMPRAAVYEDDARVVHLVAAKRYGRRWTGAAIIVEPCKSLASLDPLGTLSCWAVPTAGERDLIAIGGDGETRGPGGVGAGPPPGGFGDGGGVGAGRHGGEPDRRGEPNLGGAVGQAKNAAGEGE